jgi:hypothetical protein
VSAPAAANPLVAGEVWETRQLHSDIYNEQGRETLVKLYVRTADGLRVCDVHQDGPTPTAAEFRRWRLIAAAPAMLLALNRVYQASDDPVICAMVGELLDSLKPLQWEHDR